MKSTKKRKTLRRIAAALIITAIAAALLFVLLEKRIRPVISAAAESTAKNVASEAVNDAVRKALTDSGDYDNLVSLTLNDDGKVTAISVDSIRLNTLCADIRSSVTDYFSSLSEKTVTIALGTLTGIDMFAGKGPKIHLSVTLSGSSSAKILNEFENAGINQTRHQIILEINTKIYVIMQSQSFSAETLSSVVIAETVIVGDIPEIYSDGTNELWQNLVGYGE